MTTAALLPVKPPRGAAWLARLCIPAGVVLPALPASAVAHPTQATARWT